MDKFGSLFCQGLHTKNGLDLLLAHGHGPVGLAKPYLIFYPLQPITHLYTQIWINSSSWSISIPSSLAPIISIPIFLSESIFRITSIPISLTPIHNSDQASTDLPSSDPQAPIRSDQIRFDRDLPSSDPRAPIVPVKCISVFSFFSFFSLLSKWISMLICLWMCLG